MHTSWGLGGWGLGSPRDPHEQAPNLGAVQALASPPHPHPNPCREQNHSHTTFKVAKDPDRSGS